MTHELKDEQLYGGGYTLPTAIVGQDLRKPGRDVLRLRDKIMS